MNQGLAAVRDIAALCANQPAVAKQHLAQVVQSRDPLPGEDQHACHRRRANACYYLGLTESNFGNNLRAIELFEEANRLDPDGGNFLTGVAMADTYAMMNRFDSARYYVDQIENRLQDIEDREGPLHGFQLRLRSRARLIRANMALLMHVPDWEVPQLLLESALNMDPQYTYVIATLAQVYYGQDRLHEAQKQFDKAHRLLSIPAISSQQPKSAPRFCCGWSRGCAANMVLRMGIEQICFWIKQTTSSIAYPG